MIHRIGRDDDPRLDPYRHVADAPWLRRHQLFVAEGRLVVERTIALGCYRLRSVLVNEAAFEAMRAVLDRAGVDVYVSPDPTLARITGFNFHRGCLALVERPAALPLERLFPAARLLALEGVGNPDNVGGLFRTAGALGAGGILLGPRCGDPLYRKAIRTSMGASLRVPFTTVERWSAALPLLQDRGFRLVALTPRAEAVPLPRAAEEIDLTTPLVLLLGSEGTGLEDGTLAQADCRVRIPIEPELDSLNVVVAAGIALDRLRPA